MQTVLASDAQLLARIERYCADQAIGVTTFGREAIGDPNLVRNMRQGRSLTLKTAGVVVEFMDRKPAKVAA